MKAETLREWRLRWGLTQAGLAERMGLHRRAYIQLEMGDRELQRWHALSLERVSIDIAAERADFSLLFDAVKGTIDQLVAIRLEQRETMPEAGAAVLTKEQAGFAANQVSETRPDPMPRHHDHEGILAAWQRGEASTAIASHFGTTPGYIRTIIKKARESGDPRAVFRGRSSTSLTDKRNLDHEGILDRWSAGWRTAEIARFAHTSPGTVYDIIMGYRRRGDPRAARRRRENPAR